MIADQRKPLGAARQIIAGVPVTSPNGTLTVLPISSFGPGFAVGLTGIARVKLPAAVGAKAVDTVQIERGRAEIFDRGRVVFLVAKGGQIKCDIVIDELAEIGEPRRDLGVVSRRIGRVGVLHRVGECLKRAVIDRQRLELRKHSPEHSRVFVPGKRI